jgi:hypothetical protein
MVENEFEFNKIRQINPFLNAFYSKIMIFGSEIMISKRGMK